MKRLAILFCAMLMTAIISAMEPQHWPRPMTIICPLIVKYLRSNSPLSSDDIRQAKQLIKEIRVQSPAQGLEFQDKLSSRIADDSINIGVPQLPYGYIQIVRPPSRTPSPLITCSTN